jgi:hypothetical protein
MTHQEYIEIEHRRAKRYAAELVHHYWRAQGGKERETIREALEALVAGRHRLFPNVAIEQNDFDIINIPTCDTVFRRHTRDVSPQERDTCQRILKAIADLDKRCDVVEATLTKGGAGGLAPKVHTPQELAQAAAMHQQAYQQHRMHEVRPDLIAEHPHFQKEEAKEKSEQIEASTHDPQPTHDAAGAQYAMARTKSKLVNGMIAKSRLTFADDATRSRYASLNQKQNEERLAREALAADRTRAIASRYGD